MTNARKCCTLQTWNVVEIVLHLSTLIAQQHLLAKLEISPDIILFFECLVHMQVGQPGTVYQISHQVITTFQNFPSPLGHNYCSVFESSILAACNDDPSSSGIGFFLSYINSWNNREWYLLCFIWRLTNIFLAFTRRLSESPVAHPTRRKKGKRREEKQLPFFSLSSSSFSFSRGARRRARREQSHLMIFPTLFSLLSLASRVFLDWVKIYSLTHDKR